MRTFCRTLFVGSLLLFSLPAHALTYGDVNDDTLINVEDAIKVLQASVDLLQLTEEQERAADVASYQAGVFGDKQVNVLDAIRILQKVVDIDQTPNWPGDRSIWDDVVPVGTLPLSLTASLTATESLTRDFTLPGGFKVQGSILELKETASVILREEAQNLTLEAQTSQQGQFTVGVPEGAYGIHYYEPVNPQRPGEDYSYVFVPGPEVSVSGDVTRGFPRSPLPELYRIQGRVVTPASLGPPTAYEVAQKQDAAGQPIRFGGSLISMFGGDVVYNGVVPAGTYAVHARFDHLTYYLGAVSNETLTVTGETEQNFTLPDLVTVSGTATLSDGSPLPEEEAVVEIHHATDANVYAFAYVGEGQYATPLPHGRFRARARFTETGTDAKPAIWALDLGTLEINANTARDVAFPELPSERVSVSGKALGPDGKGLNTGTFTATSTQLAGMPPELSYTKTVGVGADGSFAIQLVPGEYRVTIKPNLGFPVLPPPGSE